MIQQNAITSPSQTLTARQARIRSYNTILTILLILGITLILSLYLYQISAIYATQLTIQDKQLEYARHQRLNAEALVLLAQTQSMESMVRRARGAGYGPPQADQIRYVRINESATLFARNDAPANRD